jgi:chromosome partitioning protein
MGKIVAIANQKGGVGKTTTAINIAACLAAAGKHILLVDTDPQGNSTSGLGIERENLNISLYNIYNKTKHINELMQRTELDYLQIIPSHIDLIGAELELITSEGRESILKQALQTIKHEYNFIFIDCPPSLSLLTLNALVAADSLLIPMQCEYYALEGISSLIKTLELVRQAYNSSLDIEGILLTMFDGRNTLANQVATELKKHFGEKVFKTMIPRNVTLAEAPSHGKPVILYDIHSKGAQSYLALAEEVMGNENGTG